MPSAKIKLFKGKTLSNGCHPIILQVIDGKKVRKLSLGLEAKPEEWVEDLSRYSKRHHGFRKQNQILEHFERKAEKIQQDLILEGKPFSHELFRTRFLSAKKQMGVVEFLQVHVNTLGELRKLNTQSTYKSTLNVLKEYSSGQEISFYNIDYEFLMDFEKFLFKRGCTEGGVNHHMRNIRAVFNQAIRKDYCEAAYYPFTTKHNDRGYSLSRVKSKAKPRALSAEDLEKLKSFPIEDYPDLIDSYFYFMFSYYTRGMNFTDLARLTRGSIQGGRIHYQRRKTGAYYSIKISPQLKSILSHFDQSPDFLFPILSDFHQTEQQQMDRIHKCLRKMNRDLSKIGNILDTSIPMTSYVARHTWASTLKRKGYSTELISEGLGHTEIATTKAYLENFSDEMLDSTDEAL